MTLTPETFPFRPYPPFAEPLDWTGTINDWVGGERDGMRARQAAHDATSLHHERHAAHQHPWCVHCEIRLTNARRVEIGGPPIVPPKAQAPESAARLPSDVRDELEDRARQGKLGWDMSDEDLSRWGDPATVREWLQHIEQVDTWEDTWSTSEVTCASRAARYLLYNGRPPLDAGPPEGGNSFDELFLDRDQLNELPTVEQLIDGVLPRHSYIILRGRDGTFKSFVGVDWSLCLATGHPWQGRHAERVRVLYIAGEGAYGITSRVDAWERTRDLQVDPEWFTTRSQALNLHKPGPAFDHLLEHIADGSYGLVVVDTLRRVSGSADGNSSEMGAVVDNLDRIRRATDNGSVLVIAHTDKGDNDSRGYSGIEDDSDAVWHAKRPEDSNRLDLKNTKSKDGPDGTVVHLQAIEAHGSLVLQAAGAEETVIASESQIKVLQTLMTVFPDGATSTQLFEASGVPKSTFYRVRADLLRQGHMTNTGTPSRPFYVRSQISDSQEGPTSENTP